MNKCFLDKGRGKEFQDGVSHVSRGTTRGTESPTLRCSYRVTCESRVNGNEFEEINM